MTTQITITLSDEVYQRAEQFARLANRDVANILADTIQLSMLPVSAAATTLEPVSVLSDAELLEVTELQMEPSQDMRLSELLNLQQANQLQEPEYRELQTLMQIYQEGLLRKATALSEAVKRGLIQPLSS